MLLNCLQQYSPLRLVCPYGKRAFTSTIVTQIMKRASGDYQYKNNTKRHKGNNMATYDRSVQSSSNIVEVQGDLFSCPATHSLAHCISADVEMGKGIAVRFKNKFGGVQDLWSQNQGPGGLAVLKRDQRYIYYLVTKHNYWDKPTYDDLWWSLGTMKEHNIKYGVKHVCMPKIGCGLDKLQWNKVLLMIRELYQGTDIHITIYHYEDVSQSGQGGARGANQHSRFSGIQPSQSTNTQTGRHENKSAKKEQRNLQGNDKDKEVRKGKGTKEKPHSNREQDMRDGPGRDSKREQDRRDGPVKDIEKEQDGRDGTVKDIEKEQDGPDGSDSDSKGEQDMQEGSGSGKKKKRKKKKRRKNKKKKGEENKDSD